MKIFVILIATFLFTQSYGQGMGLALEGEDWSTVQAYPVKGRASHINQKISFGSFKTVDIDRSWTKGSTVTAGITQGIPTSSTYKKIITTDHIHKKQTLYFVLADSIENFVSGYCLSRFDAKDFNLGDNPNSLLNILLDLTRKGDVSSSMYYVMLRESTGVEWELLLNNQQAQRMPNDYVGVLANAQGGQYLIKPYSKVKSKKSKVGTMPFGSAGFEIVNKRGKSLAAISLMDRGVIYLTETSVEEKLLLSGICTALLLQEVID
jgi:hypothetical protein